MTRLNITFPNPQGNLLAALVEMPAIHTRGRTLFADCFICSRDGTTASRISRRTLVNEILIHSTLA